MSHITLLFLALLAACAPPVTPPSAEPLVVPALTDEGRHDLDIRVTLPAQRGIRPLVAEVEAHDGAGGEVALTFRWDVDGAPTSWQGPHVPAHATWPAQAWTVTVTAATVDGRTATASASVEIPRPLGGNVLLFVLDDIGVDKFNAFGLSPQPQTTPNLDRLTNEGMLFTNAYASPLCSATRAQLLTGRHARRTGVGALIGGGSEFALSGEAILLPEALEHARGGTYTSVAVGKYHLAAPRSTQGYDGPAMQGFSSYAGSYDNLLEQPKGYYRWKKVVDGATTDSTTYVTTDTVNDALAQISSLPEPWFVLLAFNAPHTPYHVPPRALHTQDVNPDSNGAALYAAMLEASDTEFGRLARGVDPQVWSNTTVILMGDNGTGRAAVKPPFLKERAKQTVYEGGVHVPLVIAGPHVAVPGSRSDALVHAVDIFATVADLAGVPLSESADGMVLTLAPDQSRALDGWSLLPWLADPGRPSPRATVFAETFTPFGPGPYTEDQVTLRDHRWKLVRMRTLGQEVVEFFDLRQRPFDEGTDLLTGGLDAAQQAAFDRLSNALDAQLAAMPHEGF